LLYHPHALPTRRSSDHFIFIDVNMPRKNGIECLVEIKKISKVKNTPVYLYSTYGDPDTISQGKKLGAVDLLVKANNMKELEQTLDRKSTRLNSSHVKNS